MRPRRPRRRSTARSDRRLTIAIFAIAGPLLIAVLGGAWYFRPAKLDRNGCPLGNHAAPPAKTVVLVDQTDALSARELAYVRLVVRNEYGWLPIGGVLDIRSIDAAAPDGRSALVACRMADGSDALGLTDNALAMRRDYDRRVGHRLDRFLAGLADAPEQAASPILETVVAALDDPQFGRDIDARRLIVISDMAQNSATYTQYGRGGAGRLTLSPAQAAAYRVDAGDLAVRLHYIARDKLRFQGRDHQAFWTGYFRDQGMTDVEAGHRIGLGDEDREVRYDMGAAGNAM